MPTLNTRLSARPATKPQVQEGGPANTLKRMIAVIEELIQVMEAEVPMVEGRKAKEHAELLKRKQRLAIDYRASVKSLTVQADLLKQVPDDLRQKAKTALQKLSEASDRNGKILRGAITALQRLIQNIVAIVREEVLPKNVYSNPNAANRLLGIYSPTCKPIAVNRTA